MIVVHMMVRDGYFDLMKLINDRYLIFMWFSAPSLSLVPMARTIAL